ncbi:hypothetical protein BJ138DRAFT_976447, partial [Hygrophoropsis aurantiaca]
FTSSIHPQFRSHCMKLRNKFVVPVLIGDTIPRYDRTDEERERWARAVLVLFAPWRTVADLRKHPESWYASYELLHESFPPHIISTIKNINVLSECKDAR